MVITPNQPPVAGFAQGTTPANVVATFDASSSTDPDGQVVSYFWNFGDGTTQTTSIPTVTHKYATNGTYDVTLRVTDNEGCSATLVYTGQTALCNGSGVARITKTINTSAAPRPDDRVKNPTLVLKQNQRLGKRSVRVEAKVGAGESARIKMSGFIRRSKHRIKLRKRTVEVRGTNRKQVVMKVRSKRAQVRVHKLLRKAGALQVTVHADYKDDAGNRAELRQNATLLPGKRR